MRIASSKDGVKVHELRVVPTPQDYEEAIKKFTGLKDQVTNGEKIDKCVGGLTGILDQNKEQFFRSPHLPGWVGQPIKDRLSEIVNTQVLIENDSALVGLGEAVFGAGKGFEIVAFITISTGIGGVRIVNGKIDINTFGFEPGHQIIDADGTINPYFQKDLTGNTKGEFESLASGSAISKRWGKLPIEIEDEGIWEHVHWLIAQGLCNTILHWSPSMVVLGGGVVESEKISIERVKIHLNEVLKVFPYHPPIRKAQLGDLGGIYGGMAYIASL